MRLDLNVILSAFYPLYQNLRIHHYLHEINRCACEGWSHNKRFDWFYNEGWIEAQRFYQNTIRWLRSYVSSVTLGFWILLKYCHFLIRKNRCKSFDGKISDGHFNVTGSGLLQYCSRLIKNGTWLLVCSGVWLILHLIIFYSGRYLRYRFLWPMRFAVVVLYSFARAQWSLKLDNE